MLNTIEQQIIQHEKESYIADHAYYVKTVLNRNIGIFLKLLRNKFLVKVVMID